MTKVVRIKDETHEDLQAIQQLMIQYGTKTLPTEFEPIIASLKNTSVTYEMIIAIAVKFLRNILDKAHAVNTIKRMGGENDEK